MLSTDMTMSAKLNSEACWRAILDRDDDTAGRFFFGVVTTGIFCRPSCPARRPRRENVRFFRDTAEAARAGFRACKRCQPEAAAPAGQQAELITRLCRAIDEAHDMPSFAALAEREGLSVFHLHRMFKRMTGVTPKAYMASVQATRMRDGLPQAASVTDAIYGAGYSSSSRFYEHSDGILGMEPRQFRAGGDGVTMQFATGESWLGRVLVAATDRGICAIQFGDDEAALVEDLRKRFPKARIEAAGEEFSGRLAEVLDAVERPETRHDLPLDILGTVFQQRIWAALRDIPAGETASYAEIAGKVGTPRAARAVAAACAANPLAVVIPCHRVVRGNGDVSGYRWGVERKRALLRRETGVGKG
jgi:AraC family transcriptional regulator of adaptative response/methylated-DNA-[protein]-cysteine methyltransferase